MTFNLVYLKVRYTSIGDLPFIQRLVQERILQGVSAKSIVIFPVVK